MKLLRLNRVGGLVLAAALLIPLSLSAGCKLFGGAPGTIKVSEIQPLVADVVTRHDTYVNGDNTLSVELAAQYTGESAHALQILSAATGGYVSVEQIEPAMDPVMIRYDAYVSADASLTEANRVTLLRSTTILRSEVFASAKGQ